jgi:hypothetical protein
MNFLYSCAISFQEFSRIFVFPFQFFPHPPIFPHRMLEDGRAESAPLFQLDYPLYLGAGVTNNQRSTIFGV